MCGRTLKGTPGRRAPGKRDAPVVACDVLCRMTQRRENLLRGGLAVLLVLAVVALVVIDRRGGGSEQASEAPSAPGTESSLPEDSTTVAPLPEAREQGRGDRGDKDRGPGGKKPGQGTRKRDPREIVIPSPPKGLEKLVCQTLAEPVELTVLSLNMHFGRAGLGRIADQVARTGADIVLLQEVDRHVRGTGRVDQATYLARRLRMYGVFGANRPRGGGQYGTAVLSRHEILDWTNTPLPKNRRSEQRGLLRVTLEVSGQRFNVYNTHLQFGPNPIQRVQARAVNRILGADPLPKILGGDLNAWPGSRSMRALLGPVRDPWPAVGSGPGGTGPRGGRIDYVLASDHFRAAGSAVLRTTVSDHNGVLTRLVLPPHDCD